MKKRIISALLLVCTTTVLTAGCGSDEPFEAVDLNSMTLEERQLFERRVRTFSGNE